MALSAPTINQVTYDDNPGMYYLEFTGVASGVIYRAYCSALSTVSKATAQKTKRFTVPAGAVAGSVILGELPDWPHTYVCMTASDINDANESAVSNTGDCPISR